MGIAGTVLGVLAIICSVPPVSGLVLIPLVGWLIAALMVAVGLPLSSAGFRNARRYTTRAGMVFAVAGLTTNIIAAALLLFWALFYGLIFSRNFNLGPGY